MKKPAIKLSGGKNWAQAEQVLLGKEVRVCACGKPAETTVLVDGQTMSRQKEQIDVCKSCRARIMRENESEMDRFFQAIEPRLRES